MNKQEHAWHWNVDRAIMMMAGSMVLLSLVLKVVYSDWWLLLAAFVALNMIQSVFTGFCLPAIVLRRLGLRGGCAFRGSEEG